MEKARYNATQIAQWFINRAYLDVDDGGDLMTHLKLQKLLYYSQGCYIAMKDKPLFKEKIVAWTHGPVVREVYEKYKEYGARAIDKTEKVEIDEETQSVLIEVYNVFGQFSALKLREMTHSETPWKTTEQSAIISLSKIKDYFKENYITA